MCKVHLHNYASIWNVISCHEIYSFLYEVILLSEWRNQNRRSSSVGYSARRSAGFSRHQHYNWMVKFSGGRCCPARCGHCRLPPWRSPQLQLWWHSHMDNQLGECHPKAGRPTDLCFFSIFALLLAVLVVQKRYNICAWNGVLCYGYLDSNVSGKFISHYLFDVLVQC